MSLDLWNKDDAEGEIADSAVRAPYLAVCAVCGAQCLLQHSSAQLTSDQEGMYVLGKAHARYIPPLQCESFPLFN